MQKKAELLETIQELHALLGQHRAARKQVKRKVTVESLPKEQRPAQLLPLNKMLTDTVKMIAYRAETAMAALLIPHLKKEEEARALVRELLVSAADLAPDPAANTLTVRIHRMAGNSRAWQSHYRALGRADTNGIPPPRNRRENGLHPRVTCSKKCHPRFRRDQEI